MDLAISAIIALLAIVLAFMAMYQYAYEKGRQSMVWIEPIGVHDPTPEHMQVEEDLATHDEIVDNLEVNPWIPHMGKLIALPPSREDRIDELSDKLEKALTLKNRYFRLLQADRQFIRTILFSQREQDWDEVPAYWRRQIKTHQDRVRAQIKLANHDRRERFEALRNDLQNR